MTIASGTRLGPYEVTSHIGAGGMGEVYRARDTRLDRSVAIKVLATNFAGHADLRARFEREARTISQLSHPNICTLYDVGNENGADYLVMELLEGESLADRTARGPMPVADVLRYGAQIADALARAHRQGIIHRDLKPGNVMLTKSGAKLLDFGLARTLTSHPSSSPADATQHKPLTQEGTILGTFQYMAPEQLAGEQADPRTDLFALGAVLYEMATGVPAFSGKSRTSLISNILGATPRPVSELQPLTPPALERLIQRCLAKEPDDRWQSAADLADELKWIGAASSSGAPARPVIAARQRRRYIPWVVCALLAGLLAATGALLVREHAARRPLRKLALLIPTGDYERSSTIASPDTRMLVFRKRLPNGRSTIAVRDLRTTVEHDLRGTEEGTAPFWSLDGTSVGFYIGNKMYVTRLDGGTPQKVCTVWQPTGRTSWGTGGTILFRSQRERAILKVPANGGSPSTATTLDAAHELWHSNPLFVSKNEFLFFVEMREGSPKKSEEGIYLSSVTSSGKTLLLAGPWERFFYSQESLVVIAGKTASVYPLDVEGRKLTGVARTVALPFEPAGMSVTSAGDLLVTERVAEGKSKLLWYTRNGDIAGQTGEEAVWREPALSPGEDRLAVSVQAGRFAAIDVFDLKRGVRTRVVDPEFGGWWPVWLPDGERIGFSSGSQSTGGARRTIDLYVANADGSGRPAPLLRSSSEKALSDARGDEIAFQNDYELWIRNVRTGQSRQITADGAWKNGGTFSPDGRWVAYMSMVSGREEIYVHSTAGSGRRVQVSSEGGRDPRWRGDSRELFYLDYAKNLVAVDVRETAGRIETGVPHALFKVAWSGGNTSYSVTGDGQRFLVVTLPEQKQRPSYFLMNWLAEK